MRRSRFRNQRLFRLRCLAAALAALMMAGCSVWVPVHTGPQPSLTEDEAKELTEHVLARAGAARGDHPFDRLLSGKSPEELAAERYALLARLAQDKGAPGGKALEELFDANIPALNDEIMAALVEKRAAHFSPVLLVRLGTIDKDEQRRWIAAAHELDPDACQLKLMGFISDESADGSLRLAAVRSTAVLEAPAAVEVLVGALPRLPQPPARDAVRDEVFVKLEEVTGVGAGEDVAAWQRWWRTHHNVPPQRWLRNSINELSERLEVQQTQHAQHAEALSALLREALARVPADKKEKLLAKALQLDDNELKAASAREAGRLQLTGLADPVTILVEDRDAKVREEAVRALGQMKATAARGKIAHALRYDASPGVRAAAAEALGRLDERQSVTNLLPALADADTLVRDQAAASLAALGASEAAPTLARMLNQEPYRDNREAFLLALGSMGDASAVEPIMQVLAGEHADDRVRVRWAATDALGKLGDARAVGVLKAAVNDPDERVREAAVIALGRIGSDGALEALLSVSPKNHQALADAAWKAFKSAVLPDGSRALAWAARLDKAGRPAQARELLEDVFKRAVAGGEVSFEALRAGALAAKRLDRPADVRRTAEAALARNINDAPLWRVYLDSLKALGDWGAVWTAYDQFGEAFPTLEAEAVAGKVGVIDALLAAGDEDQARAFFAKLPLNLVDKETRARLEKRFQPEEAPEAQTPADDVSTGGEEKTTSE